MLLPKRPPLDQQDLKRLHDETSRILHHTQLAIISSAALTLLVLGSIETDATLLFEATTAKVQGIDVILSSFVTIMPFVFLALLIQYTIYRRHLHIYSLCDEHLRLPYPFNKRDYSMRLLNFLITFALPIFVSTLALHYSLALANWRLAAASYPILLLLMIVNLVMPSLRFRLLWRNMLLCVTGALCLTLLVFPVMLPMLIQYIVPLDLRGTKLTDEDLENRQLNHAMLDYADATNVNFSGSSLIRASLRNIKGDRSRFIGTLLIMTDFSQSSIAEVSLQDATLHGAIFDGASGQHAKLIRSRGFLVSFRFADFSSSDFKESLLNHAVFSGSKLTSSDFSYASLERSVFDRVDLRYVLFARTELPNAQFDLTAGGAWANLFQADFSDSVLDGSRFSGGRRSARLHAEKARFDRASIKDVRFRKVNLPGSSFISADLGRASFSQVDLSGADLSYADFAEASFSRVNLNNTNMRRTNLVGVSGRDVTERGCEWLQEASNWETTCRDEKLRCGTVGDLSACDLSEMDFFEALVDSDCDPS